MPETYRLADDPRPGPIEHLAVNPFWPLMAVMLGGTWLSWPWFIVNSIAVGSPTRLREIIWLLVGLGGSVLMLLGLVAMGDAGIVPREAIPYVLIAVTVWKLGVSYWVYSLQQRTFSIWEYYGGTPKNGMFVVMIGLFAGQRMINSLLETGGIMTLVAIVLK